MSEPSTQQSSLPTMTGDGALEPNLVRTEMIALQKHFMEKRDFVVKRLREIGFKIPENKVPNLTFYLWLDLRCLPESINDGLNFFKACLDEKCIVVPGIFFVSDISWTR